MRIYFVVALMLLLPGITLAAEQGRGRGNGLETAPGQERKSEREVVTVPEPATLTLLGIAVGSGLLARGWTSRRRKTPR